MQPLFQEILVEVVLGVHVRGVKIKKKFLHPDVVTMHFLHKGFTNIKVVRVITPAFKLLMKIPLFQCS
jgi:hypothetical protein